MTLTLRTATDLTPDVLTSLLRQYAPDVQVIGARVRRTWQGTSSHVHLDVDYAEGHRGGLPDHLFVKTQLDSVHGLPEAHSESLSDGGGGTTLLTSETTFYRDVRRELTAEIPSAFVAEHSAGPHQFLIIAEDVTDRGAVFPDTRAGLSVPHTAELLRSLARVHAPFWDSPRLVDGADLSWLDAPLSGPFAEFLDNSGFDIIRALLAEPYKARLLDLAGTDPDTLERSFWRLQRAQSESVRTLLHGDPHPGNIYLLPDGGVGLLDWQLVRRGSWAHDVSYALVAALDPADRRAGEKELLAGYLDELRAAGVSSPPSWEEAFSAYRISPVWGFCMWAITPGQMYSDELVEAVLHRFAVACAELGTREALGL